MKIALFGSTGFVGQHLLDGLEAEIIPVNIRKIAWESQIPADVDAFINCIGKAHDHKNEAGKQDFYFANYDLVKEMFTAFLESSAKLFIHLSSIAAVEEISADIPLTEDATSNSTSLYGKSKRKAEEWLLQQQLPPNKKLIILRPPMIHGEGDKGSLKLLYNMVSKGIPYPLAAFENQRSFITVENVLFFIERIIENKDNLESGIYHIADDEPISTNQIIEIINDVENGNNFKFALPKFLVNALAKIGDMVSFFPLNSVKLKKMTSNLLVSNQKIKTALKIENLPLSAEEGLIKTVKSFKSIR